MELVPDHRTFLRVEERLTNCVQCGKDLVILPSDMRGGLCFDCLRTSSVEGYP